MLRRVLLTGAAGRTGMVVRSGLQGGSYTLPERSGFDDPG